MTKLRESLVEAERHAEEGQALVDEQRAHVAELMRQGNDAGEAEHLLVQFEAVQETLIADRDRLRRLVANIESDWPQSLRDAKCPGCRAAHAPSQSVNTAAEPRV